MTIDELLQILTVQDVGYDAHVDKAFNLIPDGLCCEFGVYAGRTLIPFANKLAPRKLYGFDSFEGLPEDWCGMGPKGSFKADPAAIELPANAELVIGLFQDTLEPFLALHSQPVAFCHFDADLYSSTKYVLGTIRPWLAKGAILIFDEIIGDVPCHEHEARAFAEWVTENGIEFQVIGMRHRKAAIFQINGYFMAGETVCCKGSDGPLGVRRNPRLGGSLFKNEASISNAYTCRQLLTFGHITRAEATDCILKWHYAGHLGRGQHFHGAYLETQLIACAVFDDTNCSINRTTEFMAHGRDPTISQKLFQTSQLLSWSCKQLRKDYDVILTYCELHRAGSIFKGSSWNYNGHGALYHEYWKAITPKGNLLACTMGLKSLKYPT